MKHILAVLTGGTIGSSLKNGIISPDNGSSALSVYEEWYHDDVKLTVCQPMNLLSENLNCHHWELLVNTLRAMPLDDYDGIIITHGSDTLSYSSAMLAMCLSDLPKPVVITASNLVPEHPDSNAAVNLHAAAVLIRTFARGIFTVYQNPGADGCAVYIPTRLCECHRYSGCFSSFDGTPYGLVKGDCFRQLLARPDAQELVNFHSPLMLTQPLTLSKEVLLLRPYPSMPYERITLPESVGAVLQITYHSSTACSEPENSALTLLQRCEERGIPFYMASFPKRSAGMYASTDILVKNGAIPLYDLSDEAAYAKLLLACNLYSDSRDWVSRDYYFETV